MTERIRPRTQAQITNGDAGVALYNPKLFPKTCSFLAQRGATVAEMASACSVNTRTFFRWLVQYPELNDAVTAGKDAFNTRVVRALAERATGFEADVEEVKVLSDGEVVRYNVRKYFPPDVTAGIYWTKNRMPEDWRDVQRIDLNAKVLQSSDEIQQLLLAEFKDLIEAGLLQLPQALPAPRKMREINPRRSDEDNDD